MLPHGTVYVMLGTFQESVLTTKEQLKRSPRGFPVSHFPVENGACFYSQNSDDVGFETHSAPVESRAASLTQALLCFAG